jgi:hypothetical protein
MKITPQQRIEAYKQIAAAMSEDHEYFMKSLYVIADQLADGSASKEPQFDIEKQNERTIQVSNLFLLVEDEQLKDAILAYQQERLKVLELLMGQPPDLKTAARSLNESMQELLSQISQAIVRNQNQ